MELTHINITDLKISPANVRKHGRGNIAKSVGDLIPSIRSLGVLQPLLVRPNCEGYEIVAGQRRYHACAVLAEDDEAFASIPCIIMDDSDDATAIEASLAENVARLPMDEIDQYKAFAALVKQGASVEEIASQFGVTERLVAQRLAIANLIGPILTAYRNDEIGPTTVRLLTMATKAQQKKWVALHKSEEERAPEGYRLKCWLFGGAEIATEAALFDLGDYPGNIISDLFGDERYFDDPEAFWALQNTAIAEARDAYLAEGWSDVIVLDVGEYFPSYEYVDTAKEDGGKVYVHVANNGEATFYEGQLSRKEIKARQRSEAGEAPAPKPEITKAMQSYLALHRHAAVRRDVLANPGTALRLIAAHMIAGSGLWNLKPEPQKADKEATAESLAVSPTQQAFEAERTEIAGLLGIDEGEDITRHGGAWQEGRNIVTVFDTLQKLDDAQITRILAFVMAETLEADTALIEHLGPMLGTDPAQDWHPDDTFFDLLRDKQTINAMVGEIAGENVAKANLTVTAKVQKGIIQDCLNGTRKQVKQDWTPRYMAFPMQAYTDRGGICAIELAESLPDMDADEEPAKAA